VQLVESRQSIWTAQPEAGQSIEQPISFGHLMSVVQGLHALPQANVQTPLTQLPPAFKHIWHWGVSVGVPQTIPPPPVPTLPPAPPLLAPLVPLVPPSDAPPVPAMGAPPVPPVPVSTSPPTPPMPAVPVSTTPPAPPMPSPAPAAASSPVPAAGDPAVPAFTPPVPLAIAPSEPYAPPMPTPAPAVPEAAAPPDNPALSTVQPAASRPAASHATRAVLDRISPR
jgi:hypothetical protein